MSKPVEGFYESAKYLGQFIPEIEPMLQETACIGDSERVIIAVLKYLKEQSDDKEEKKELQSMIDLVKALGFARWKRDTVTDMAIKIGKREEQDSFADDTANINSKESAPDST